MPNKQSVRPIYEQNQPISLENSDRYFKLNRQTKLQNMFEGIRKCLNLIIRLVDHHSNRLNLYAILAYSIGLKSVQNPLKM